MERKGSSGVLRMHVLVVVAALSWANVVKMALAFTSADYASALDKSLLFYDVQRSGKLPSWQRIKWRGNSALNDGGAKKVPAYVSLSAIDDTMTEAHLSIQPLPANFTLMSPNLLLKFGYVAQVNITGGYYDAGDNVKFGLPMAFTITLLAWNVVEFSDNFRSTGQLQNALNNIRWGTDYLLRCYTSPTELWVQVSL